MRAVDWLRRSQWKLHATVLNGRYFLCARCCYFYSYSFSHGNPDLTEDQNTYVCTFKRVRTDSSMCDGYGICSYDVCVIEFCDSTSESVIPSPVSARQYDRLISFVQSTSLLTKDDGRIARENAENFSLIYAGSRTTDWTQGAVRLYVIYDFCF